MVINAQNAQHAVDNTSKVSFFFAFFLVKLHLCFSFRSIYCRCRCCCGIGISCWSWWLFAKKKKTWWRLCKVITKCWGDLNNSFYFFYKTFGTNYCLLIYNRSTVLFICFVWLILCQNSFEFLFNNTCTVFCCTTSCASCVHG